MRVYAHWLIRFGWIAIFVPPALVFAVMAAIQPLVPNAWLALVQAAGFIALGVRAAIGGVQVTEHEFLVRNLFSTKCIPRTSVTGIGSLGTFWAIEWTTAEGNPAATQLTMLPGFGRPFALHWHNEQSIERLRDALSETFPIG
ncbi:hypothetical protein [Pseudolysinimonas sp.]|jgi:hypothetical protein|uniref:hypothetical protein n=1 Tax=Pseudolysinimonas sp. TaxID=2680009 RepID=UPI0037842F40